MGLGVGTELGPGVGLNDGLDVEGACVGSRVVGITEHSLIRLDPIVSTDIGVTTDSDKSTFPYPDTVDTSNPVVIIWVVIDISDTISSPSATDLKRSSPGSLKSSVNSAK